MSDKIKWQYKYQAPVPAGQVINIARPGAQIANALMEIQREVKTLKQAETPGFQWKHRVHLPHDRQVIRTLQPGLIYANSITEIQDTIDGLSGVSADLITAYSEHRQAIGQAAYEITSDPGEARGWLNRYNRPMAGETISGARPGLNIARAITEIQDILNDSTYSIETEMQTWLEANCTSFIDHVNGPLNEDEDEFLMFTLESWRAAAGITGAWLDGDLEKGFNALDWTWAEWNNYPFNFPEQTGGRGYEVVPGGANFYNYAIAAKAEALTNWPNDWGQGDSVPHYNGSSSAGLTGDPDGWYEYKIGNSKHTLTFPALSQVLYELIDEQIFYVVADKGSSDVFWSDSLSDGINQISPDELEDGTYQIEYGSLDQPTLADLPPDAFFVTWSDSLGWDASAIGMLRKWNFTQA